MKKVPMILSCLLTAAAVIFTVSSCRKTYPAKTEDQIEDFLSGCGIEVSGPPSVKTVTVPREFGDVYENYNELQRSQGFDLSNYKAREAKVYTYDIVSVNGGSSGYTEAHVMVCDGVIIGADMMSPALDGGMSAVM